MIYCPILYCFFVWDYHSYKKWLKTVPVDPNLCDRRKLIALPGLEKSKKKIVLTIHYQDSSILRHKEIQRSILYRFYYSEHHLWTPETYRCYKRASQVCTFNVLYSNIFTLRKLKYILFPINDFHCSIGLQFSNVTCSFLKMMPIKIRIQSGD
jgi:hypothetical protein